MKQNFTIRLYVGKNAFKIISLQTGVHKQIKSYFSNFSFPHLLNRCLLENILKVRYKKWCRNIDIGRIFGGLTSWLKRHTFNERQTGIMHYISNTTINENILDILQANIHKMMINKTARFRANGKCTNHLFRIQHPITNTGRFPQWWSLHKM